MMKKVLSLLIALLFSFSFAAFAEEKPTTDAGAAKIEGKSDSGNATQVKKKKTTKKSKKTKKTKKNKKTQKTEKPQQESQPQ
jgi:uncharacterized protein YxeA